MREGGNRGERRFFDVVLPLQVVLHPFIRGRFLRNLLKEHHAALLSWLHVAHISIHQPSLLLLLLLLILLLSLHCSSKQAPQFVQRPNQIVLYESLMGTVGRGWINEAAGWFH